MTMELLIALLLVLGVFVAWKFKPALAEKARDVILTLGVVSIGLLVGLYLISAASGYAPKEAQMMVAMTAIGWGLGYFAAGFLIGFLFGIPKVLQGDGAANPKPPGYQQRVNTNLEQISDWLTKIIVGLGLVQLRSVPVHLYNAAEWMARSFVPLPVTSPPAVLSPAAVSFAGGFIIFFSIVGFMGGYMATRLFIAGAFSRADQSQTIVDQHADLGASPDPADEANKGKLRNFWQPGGTENPKNRSDLQNWLATQGKSGVVLADLVYLPDLAPLRKAAVAHFNL